MDVRSVKAIVRDRRFVLSTDDTAVVPPAGLIGLETPFREKLEWLEEVETLSLKFPINRARAIAKGRIAPDTTAMESAPSLKPEY